MGEKTINRSVKLNCGTITFGRFEGYSVYLYSPYVSFRKAFFNEGTVAYNNY